MEPVGMTNACTRVVVRNSSSRTVMVHSAMVPRGGSPAGSIAVGGSAASGTGTAGAVGSVVCSKLTSFYLTRLETNCAKWGRPPVALTLVASGTHTILLDPTG